MIDGHNTPEEDVKIEKYTMVQQPAMEQALLVALYYMEYVGGTYKDVGGRETPPPIAKMTRWASIRRFD